MLSYIRGSIIDEQLDWLYSAQLVACLAHVAVIVSLLYSAVSLYTLIIIVYKLYSLYTFVSMGNGKCARDTSPLS